MKFSLVAALVLVLTIAHGTESKTLVKREVPDVEQVTKIVQDMVASFRTAALAAVEKVKAHELTAQAQTLMADGRAKMEPMLEQAHAGAVEKLNELRPYMDTMQEHLKPLTDNIETHVKPIVDNLEAQFKPILDEKIKPITDPIVDQVMQIVRDFVDQAQALTAPQP